MFLASPPGALLPDSLWLRLRFRLLMGRRLDLRHPVSFNEKLQWLKLNDRNPLYTKMVDKLAVKRYVSGLIGPEHVVPVLGVWDSPEEIDFDSLPDSFVLKATHDSGGVTVVRDKASLDRQSAISGLSASLRHNFYRDSREWPYKDVHPRIIAEECLEGEINDYKFFCFDGRPAYMFIATGREYADRETCFDFYDMDFHHIPVTNGHPCADTPPSRPANWEKMKQLASVLSAGIPHVRVDFYEAGGRVYFGEFTFYHWSGMVPFVPDDLDYWMGDLLKLPEK